MATFTNQATLSYNGVVRTSNVATGEIIDVLSITKNSLETNYRPGDSVTYIINLNNSGTTPLTNLTLDDNLGAYTFNAANLYPLSYVDGSLRYYVDGVLQPTPTVVSTSPLQLSGITVPASGNALLVYEALVTNFASSEANGIINNTATVSGAGITTPASSNVALTAISEPELSVNKSVSPTSVVENGTLTFTFVIQNTGNAQADATANAIISDSFNPVLQNIAVTLNGVALAPNTDYTYNETTGDFATNAGVITVPAATYNQNETNGEFEITPGVSTLTVTGTI